MKLRMYLYQFYSRGLCSGIRFFALFRKYSPAGMSVTRWNGRKKPECAEKAFKSLGVLANSLSERNFFVFFESICINKHRSLTICKSSPEIPCGKLDCQLRMGGGMRLSLSRLPYFAFSSFHFHSSNCSSIDNGLARVRLLSIPRKN